MRRYLLVFVLFNQIFFYAGNKVHQDRLKVAKAGDSVHLSCKGSEDVKTNFAWIKQKFDEKPLVIATSYQYQPGIFHNDFAKSGRFKTEIVAGSFALSISNLEPSDTATYYCANIYFYELTFKEGTLLIVEGEPLKKYTVLQQPVFEAVHPGDSVTLQCSVLTDTSAGEHSVYWFRHGSEEFHPGIIYSYGNRSDQCEKSSETGSPTHSCVYKLTKRNLSLSDAGTYYCAVAVGGYILFGNRTELHIKGCSFWNSIVLALASSNIVFVCMTVILGGLLCKYRQKSDTDASRLNQVEERDAMNYASLSFSQRPPSSRRSEKKMKQDQSLYAQVKTQEKE